MRSSDLNCIKLRFDLIRKVVICTEKCEAGWREESTSTTGNIRSSRSTRCRQSRRSHRSDGRCLCMRKELGEARKIDSNQLRKILPRGSKTALSKRTYIICMLPVCGVEDFGIRRCFLIDAFNLSFLGVQYRELVLGRYMKKSQKMVLQLQPPMYASACE